MGEDTELSPQSRVRQVGASALPPGAGSITAFALGHHSLGVVLGAVIGIGVEKIFGVLKEATREQMVVFLREIVTYRLDRFRKARGIPQHLQLVPLAPAESRPQIEARELDLPRSTAQEAIAPPVETMRAIAEMATAEEHDGATQAAYL
jgi:hypothetical protein